MKVFLFLLLAPLGLVAAGAAGPDVLGAWDCVATDARGAQTRWTLTVRDDGGKLGATLRSADGFVLNLLDPKLEANRFTFRVRINETEVVEAVLKVEGDRMEGEFSGIDSGRGAFRATRAGGVNVSGRWSGEWEISPDGAPGPHYMVLRQEGEKVTGTAGPSGDRQLDIANGRLAGDKLRFDIAVGDLKLGFEFTVSGDAMTGTALFAMNGTERKLKLAARRVAP